MQLSAQAKTALVAWVALIGAVSLARREPTNGSAQAAAAQIQVEAPAPVVVGVQADALRDGQAIDPNRASAAELELLPGIGPSLAKRLIESRTNQGPFRSAQDLRRVKGVGAKTLARFERFLRFDSKQVEHSAQAELNFVGARNVARLDHQAEAQIGTEGPRPRPEIVDAQKEVATGPGAP